MLDNERILVLAPHTDDGEFGCGGSIAKFIEEGAEIYYAAFSLCEESVPDGWPKDILEKELKRAIEVWGISNSNLLIYGYPVRRFAGHRQEILEDLVGLQRKLKPTVVFMPSFNDLHQDHHIIAQEGIRAFKKTTILAYEMPWNNLNFNTQCFIKIEYQDLKKKIQALSFYETQQHKAYMKPKFIESWAITRGVQCGAEYAEAFENIRRIF